jgi:hypothetical protein
MNVPGALAASASRESASRPVVLIVDAKPGSATRRPERAQAHRGDRPPATCARYKALIRRIGGVVRTSKGIQWS